MIEFTRQLKMGIKPSDPHMHFEHKDIIIKNFNMNNFTIGEKTFSKYMPFSWDGGYILITKDKEHYYEELQSIKYEIIFVQVALLALFALISYFLSLRALRPMQEAIVKLDNFSKDLIHDLNTPVTSILLNTKILERSALKESKAVTRIKKSAQEIGELHNNLTLLLKEDSLSMERVDLFEVIEEVVQIQSRIFTEIRIEVQKSKMEVFVNGDALKQILSNLISNACKYNKADGYVKIYAKEGVLYIEDGGIGIKNPSQIFERSYKETSRGHGIGLDIVKRLCDAMHIKIRVSSALEEGTLLRLEFLS